MIAVALQAEVEDYLERHRGDRDIDGRALVVRNGKARARGVTVGSGTMSVEAPRVNDKRVVDGERQRFTSKILPPYLRKSPKVAEVLPLLYLHGLSTGDFRQALPVLLGDDAAGLSPSAITRLLVAWQDEYHRWRTRSLADRDYVYVWADGVPVLAPPDSQWLSSSCSRRSAAGAASTLTSSCRWSEPASPSSTVSNRSGARKRSRASSRISSERSPLDHAAIHNS
jgi:hypothetical protein